jgi:hypothetical protein
MLAETRGPSVGCANLWEVKEKEKKEREKERKKRG